MSSRVLFEFESSNLANPENNDKIISHQPAEFSTEPSYPGSGGFGNEEKLLIGQLESYVNEIKQYPIEYYDI